MAELRHCAHAQAILMIRSKTCTLKAHECSAGMLEALVRMERRQQQQSSGVAGGCGNNNAVDDGNDGSDDEGGGWQAAYHRAWRLAALR